MCDKNYWDHAEILDIDVIVTHLFLMCAELYKSALMKVQDEAETNDMDIT